MEQREQYERPELEIVDLEKENEILTSGCGSGSCTYVYACSDAYSGGRPGRLTCPRLVL